MLLVNRFIQTCKTLHYIGLGKFFDLSEREREVREMASWNSIPLEITYEVLGWTAFLSWSISFYPQVILNFRRKRYHYDASNFPSSSFTAWISFPWFLILLLCFFGGGVVNVVWWGWTSISCCWIWRSTRRIWYTTRPSTSAPLFRSSTTRNTAMDRFVLSSCKGQEKEKSLISSFQQRN